MMILDLLMQRLLSLVIIYVFDMSYQQKFTASQPIKIEFKFDGFVPSDINGYALVLTNILESVSSDVQKHFD